MQDATPWKPDTGRLAGDLHHLRNALDGAVVRLTAVPDLVKVANSLEPRSSGLDAILSTVRQAIGTLPDGRGPVALALFGLTPTTAGQSVRIRREHARAEYESLTGTGTKYESFRTGAERSLILDLAKVLVELATTSRRTALTAGRTRTGTLHPTLPYDEEVAAEVLAFIDTLVSPRLRLAGSQVGGTCDWLYEELLGYLVDVLGRSLVDCLSHTELGPARLEARREGAHATRVLCPNTTFIISAGSRPARPFEVEIAIAQAGSPQMGPELQLSLGHEGRLVLASFAMAPVLAKSDARLATTIRTVLDTGDRVIETFVVSQLAFDTTGAVARLYGLVRRCFQRELADKIRLFILDPELGGGMHLDERAGNATQQSLRADFGVDGLGSAEKLLRLAIARFPTEDSVAAEIVPSMQTVVRSPLRIPSARSVGAIQNELFGTELVLQPLLDSEHLWIEAGYPAALRSDIEPVLDRHRGVIAEVARELDFGPALREPVGAPFDLARARQRRQEVFEKTFGHLITGYPSES